MRSAAEQALAATGQHPIQADFTTNTDIEREAYRLGLPLRFCWHADALPKKLVPGGYILNLAPSGQQGSHWTALWLERGQLPVYQDSFGLPAPQVVLDRLRGPYVYNTLTLQHPNAGQCGAFAIEFIEWMARTQRRGAAAPVRAQEFISSFGRGGFERTQRVLLRKTLN